MFFVQKAFFGYTRKVVCESENFSFEQAMVACVWNFQRRFCCGQIQNPIPKSQREASTRSTQKAAPRFLIKRFTIAGSKNQNENSHPKRAQKTKQIRKSNKLRQKSLGASTAEAIAPAEDVRVRKRKKREAAFSAIKSKNAPNGSNRRFTALFRFPFLYKTYILYNCTYISNMLFLSQWGIVAGDVVTSLVM